MKLPFHMTGTAEEIINRMEIWKPGTEAALQRARGAVESYTKREIRWWEAAVVYACACEQDWPGREILEIGTCLGWSAAVMAEAAPNAQIATCTPRKWHVERARKNLERYENVTVHETRSQDWIQVYHGPPLDMIFIDGDHDRIEEDLFWWDLLNPGGLMLHHDYTPPDATVRPCRPVWDALNTFAEKHGPPQLLFVGPDLEGVAGWYK